MNRKKIVFIGGGSVSWTPRIVKDMLLTDAISDSHYVLFDIDLVAAKLVLALCEKLNSKLGKDAVFSATDKREEAFADADYFVITISTGGLDAMAHDLAIPEEYGIYHTVGDTSGPGGWVRFIRNFDVFVSLAGDMNSYAGDAVVLNYTNPMSTLTDVLSRICTGPVVGLCHGLFENLEKIVAIYGLSGESELSVSYAGLNHFFWTTQARTKELDILADLKARIASESLTELLKKTSAAVDEGSDTSRHDPSSVRELSTALFRETGVMPYFGDRHTCEFFPCYITNKDVMNRFKLVRTSIGERAESVDKRRKQIIDAVDGKLPESFLERSRETAADIIAAHSSGGSFIDVGNLPNIGQISNLPTGLVVETAVHVNRNGFTPLAFGELPQPVLGFVEPYAHSFPMVVDACFRRDKMMALSALRLDPVCSHLTGDQVVEMGNRLLDTHSDFISAFK